MSAISDNIVEKFIYVCPNCKYHCSKYINDKPNTIKACPNCNAKMLDSKFVCETGSLKSELEISE